MAMATESNAPASCAGDRPPEQQNVRLRLVLHVVDPAARLLHTNCPPFLLAHQVLGQQPHQLLGQHDMPARKSNEVSIISERDTQ